MKNTYGLMINLIWCQRLVIKKFPKKKIGVLHHEKNLRWDIASLPLGAEEDDGSGWEPLVVLVLSCRGLGCPQGWEV